MQKLILNHSVNIIKKFNEKLAVRNKFSMPLDVVVKEHLKTHKSSKFNNSRFKSEESYL